MRILSIAVGNVATGGDSLARPNDFSESGAALWFVHLRHSRVGGNPANDGTVSIQE